MARTAICGWEVGILNEQILTAQAIGSGVTIDTGTKRSGTRSLKIVTTSGAQSYVQSGILQTPYQRIYVMVTVRPATARILMGQTGASLVNIRLNPSGTLAYYVDTTLVGTSTTALTDTARWYCIEVRSGTGTGVDVLRIDTVAEVNGTISATTGIGSLGGFDSVAATYTAYYDDYVGDDAAFPGTGNVVMLRPTSLSAAGGWVEGDGAGTAGMAAAVATTPPPGVASASETAATNIESPTNSATDNCDMNMTTYTAAGIGASDTINAVMGLIRDGEDIATGTKAGAILIVSNPSSAPETAFNYGNDAGAHGSDVSGAGLWETSVTNIVASPAVTKGTAPVLRVGKRTATTRVVCVDFMGIYVDYTPAVAATVSLPSDRGRRRRSMQRTRV